MGVYLQHQRCVNGIAPLAGRGKSRLPCDVKQGLECRVETARHRLARRIETEVDHHDFTPIGALRVATIRGFEVMRLIRKGQCLLLESGVAGEVRSVNRLFGLAA